MTKLHFKSKILETNVKMKKKNFYSKRQFTKKITQKAFIIDSLMKLRIILLALPDADCSSGIILNKYLARKKTKLTDCSLRKVRVFSS